MTAPIEINVMTDEEVAAFGRDAEAGFGALQTARGLLPLVAMDVAARVAGVIASIEVAQTFVNATGAAIEATYIFPLPDRAAVNRFRMEVGGRVVEGVIDERGAAREQYDQAVAAGHRASIAEEERAGVFTLRVGNLMPGEAATVRLSLVGPLPVDDGEVTFRFPLVVAPRYMPGSALGGEQAGLGTAADTNLVPDASRISPPVLLPGCPNPVRLAISVAIESGAPRAVASSLHAVTSALRDAQVIEIKPGERLDRDFILRWRADGSELRTSLVCADDADGKGGTFALTLVPPSTTAVAAKPRDVVFVIDRSGSMAGWKMVAARRAAARMIDTLTSRDRFRAIAFDDAIESLSPADLTAATDRARYQAVEALAKVESDGGTEMAEPLRAACATFREQHMDRERVIVLVTDGQVGNEDHILREIAPQLRSVKMFALGIDRAVNAAFLRRLAGAGGGLCELVESEDRLDEVMMKVHRRIGTPVLTDVRVRGIELAVTAASVAPRKLPDVYAGAPVTIFGRYTGAAPANAKVELAGTSFGEAQVTAVDRARDGAASGWLAASWARAAIRDLEDQYAVDPSNELEAAVVGLSKQHGVLSRFTAFVAIDKAEVANKGGRITQLVQPVEAPEGWAEVTVGAFTGQSTKKLVPMREVRGRFAAPGGQARGGKRLLGAKMMAAPASPPMAPPPMAPAPMAAREKAAVREDGGWEGDELVLSAYLAALAHLARELEAAASGAMEPTALRRIRQRLDEWIEDVRSVGGHTERAAAVEAVVARLRAALGAPDAAAIAALARELAALAVPKRGGRAAFWK